VSTDIIGNPHGSVFDSALTSARGNFAKVFSWYDNEYAFACRMVDMMLMM
jgi:glyceraldehyde 3-phosphate dehydrogenase